MQYVASVADQAGVSFERMIGYIAVGSETTRLSAETIGQGWKSILSRFGNIAAGKDVDDMGEPINNVEKSLDRLGIQIRKSDGDMRNFGDVLDDVHAKWDSLNKTEQNQIATAMAG